MKKRRFGVSSHIDPLDTERILQTLASHGVEYVLIGGLAALAHGSTIATADADVLPRMDIDNLERLLDALEELGASIFVPEPRGAMEGGDPWEATELSIQGAEALQHADAWHFTTDAGPIDVVVRSTGVGPYDSHLPDALELTAFGITLRVAGLSDLIASKESTGRPKDEAILRELRDLREHDL